MKKLCKPISRLTIALLMILMLVVTSCIGCAKQGAGNGGNSRAESAKENEIVDLMQNVTVDAVDIEAVQVEDDFCVDAADFAIALLQENMTDENENVMVSPVSALTALAMTANGARGDTREQMLAVLAPNQSMDDLNSNITNWADGLVSTDTASVKIANSIWFDESAGDITVNEIFLQRNALYYHADIYQTAFQKSTVGAINQWVSDKTDGMITNILDQIPSDTRMYLLNAVSFDAEWKRVYWPNEVHERTFTNASGEEEKADMMQSNERGYIEDENAVGFIKPYKEGYSFVALLPNEGMSAKEYIDTLSGGYFLDMIANAGMDGIDILEVQLPKFEAEYEAELSDKLKDMGMADAFDGGKADFSGIAKPESGDNAENLIISGVHHKTYIKVDELGTKAAASSDAAAATSDAAESWEPVIVYVILNRPFVYAIVENETNIPIFIGVVNSVAK